MQRDPSEHAILVAVQTFPLDLFWMQLCSRTVRVQVSKVCVSQVNREKALAGRGCWVPVLWDKDKISTTASTRGSAVILRVHKSGSRSMIVGIECCRTNIVSDTPLAWC